jgi:two-component system CheB/CheR fusion protein
MSFQAALAAPDGALPSDAVGLVSAARALAASSDVARVMEVVRVAARELTRADGVTFVLREGALVHYADEDAIAPLWKGRRFPAEACISGWAMIHRVSVVIEDVFADDRIPFDVYRPTFVKSLAMVPVRPEDPVAAIGAYWSRRHRATPRELELLECLAGLASVALANLAALAELRLALRAREEFVSIASHELRTPVTALALQVHQALRSADEGPGGAVRGSLERVTRSVERLTRLVEALLQSTRGADPAAVPLEEVDLAAIARDAVLRYRTVRRAEVAVGGESSLVGRWDRDALEQIVEGLLPTAVKFGEGKPVSVAVERCDGAARIVVRDEGMGIPLEDQRRVFERFERGVSARHYGGFGLGLWLARAAAERHGGTIELESAPGRGSTFTVVLPLRRHGAA